MGDVFSCGSLNYQLWFSVFDHDAVGILTVIQLRLCQDSFEKSPPNTHTDNLIVTTKLCWMKTKNGGSCCCDDDDNDSRSSNRMRSVRSSRENTAMATTTMMLVATVCRWLIEIRIDTHSNILHTASLYIPTTAHMHAEVFFIDSIIRANMVLTHY